MMKIPALLGYAFVLLIVASLPARADEAAIERIHQKILKKYSAVQHMDGTVLAETLADPHEAKNIVLFDVRELREHRVSRISDAAQIKPGIWTSAFLKKHGDKIAGKTVVFYCSVGRRSSYAASYLQDALRAKGAQGVFSLKGGIFSWHNHERRLNDSNGQTAYVHPYNKYWGRLIERRNLTRFKPRKPGSSSSGHANAATAPTDE